MSTSPPPAPSLRALLTLALPMVLARMTQSVDTFADTLQVKSLGQDAIAATSAGGFNTFGLVILPMGTVFILQSFVAQHLGRGERDRARPYAYYGLAIALIAGLVALALMPLVRPALGLLSYAPDVEAQMGDYVMVRLLSVGAIVGTEALGAWYGGLGNTWMQMVAAIISMVANIVANYLFINGNLGMPALGVEGAALSSVIASWLGLAFLSLAFARGWGGATRSPGPLGLSFKALRRVFRFGVPNGVNWFFEFAAFQLFINVVMADLGTEAVAALSIVIAINSLSFMPAFGLSSAGAILAGQLIGAGARDQVWAQVKITLAATATWMGVIGLAYVVAPGPLIGLFADDSGGVDPARLIELGTGMLLLSAAWQLFDAVTMTIAETLRAAGDTTWTAGARLILAWLVFAPTALVAVKVLHGGALVAMACLVGYLALLAAAMAWRFRSGAWKRIELIEPVLVD